MKKSIEYGKVTTGAYEGRRVKPCEKPTYVGGDQKGQATGLKAPQKGKGKAGWARWGK